MGTHGAVVDSGAERELTGLRQVQLRLARASHDFLNRFIETTEYFCGPVGMIRIIRAGLIGGAHGVVVIPREAGVDEPISPFQTFSVGREVRADARN